MTDAAPGSDLEQTQARVRAAEWMLQIKRAQVSLIEFARFTMPDPERADDPSASRYEVQPHHRVLAEAMEDIAAGKRLRVAISLGPQHGKSEIATRRFIAWFMGRFPHKNVMCAAYNQDFANNFGAQVRDIIESNRFKQVFPACRLRKGGKAKHEMFTTEGGQMSFLGRGGSGTGKPADLFVIDDPLKDAVEAGSAVTLAELWEWYTKVVFSRCHAGSAIAITHTRWSENDLIGRLCDPDHPEHDELIAKEWLYLNIPAVFDVPEYDGIAKALGKKRGDVLWPEKFPLTHLQMARRLNPRGFEALYQGRPAPADGDYFKSEMLVEYRSPDDIPANLRKYGSSDHAVTTKRENDASVLGCVGVDARGIIWILPDLVWDRMETPELVEAWLGLMRRHKPDIWWAEDELIKKSVGPFLRKRQVEESVFCYVEGIRPIQDKKGMARSAQGLAALKRFRFPSFAPWWQRAKNELLKFPAATHDDFVSFLSMVGLGIEREVSASPAAANTNVIDFPVGTIGWIKQRERLDKANNRPRLRVVGEN